MIITIGGVLFDMPYGITGEEWDKRLDAKKMDRILKQVAATTKSKKWFSFNWHSPEMTTDVLASLKKTLIRKCSIYVGTNQATSPPLLCPRTHQLGKWGLLGFIPVELKYRLMSALMLGKGTTIFLCLH